MSIFTNYVLAWAEIQKIWMYFFITDLCWMELYHFSVSLLFLSFPTFCFTYLSAVLVHLHCKIFRTEVASLNNRAQGDMAFKCHQDAKCNLLPRLVAKEKKLLKTLCKIFFTKCFRISEIRSNISNITCAYHSPSRVSWSHCLSHRARNFVVLLLSCYGRRKTFLFISIFFKLMKG